MARRAPNKKGMRGVGYSSRINAKVREQRMRDIFFRHLILLAFNQMQYDNLPTYADRWTIRNSLIYYGSVLFFETPALGVTALPFVGRSRVDIFQNPVYRQGVTDTGYRPVRNAANSVIVYNDDTRRPFIDIVWYYADLLTQCEIAKYVNREQNKRGKAIITSADNAQSVREILAQRKEGIPYVLTDEAYVQNVKTSTLDLSSPIILHELDDDKNRVYSEYLTMLGYETVNIDKKAQLTSRESLSNYQHTLAMRNDALTVQQEGFEKVNKMFGTNIQVSFGLPQAVLENEFGQADDFVKNQREVYEDG